MENPAPAGSGPALSGAFKLCRGEGPTDKVCRDDGPARGGAAGPRKVAGTG